MNNIGRALKIFGAGIAIGVKETPRGFFAPAVVIWNSLVGTTDMLTKQKNGTKHA
ncbi:MAG: hypothetical protein PHQ60_02255 [Sideroxydans sp.]|nr:hypothetical protein [Sideroxydans sp.]MDD5056666.1 hypothetical protein [Sideroxydans sp.]